MSRGFTHGDGAVMTSDTDIGGLIVGKRNDQWYPLTGVVASLTGICRNGVIGAFIAGAVTATGDTCTDNGLVVTERNDRRYPSAGVMTSVTVVTGLRVRGRFATDAVA